MGIKSDPITVDNLVWTVAEEGRVTDFQINTLTYRGEKRFAIHVNQTQLTLVEARSLAEKLMEATNL